MSKRLWLMAVMVLGMWITGCGPKWVVITQASPNPFLGKKEFVVLPVDYSGLKVGKKTEEEYLSEKKDKTVDSFQNDKADMADKFQASLRSEARRSGISVEPGAGEVSTFVIKPHIGFMEPGFYAVIVSKPSQVIMRLKIESKDGKLLDEVEFQHQTPPSNWGNVAAGSRYRVDAEQIGRLVGMYLRMRVSGVQ